MRRMLVMLLVCLLPLTALAEEAVLKDSRSSRGELTHMRVVENVLYMTIDGGEPLQPILLKEGFVEKTRMLEEAGEYTANPDGMNSALYPLLDDSLTGGRKVREMDVRQYEIVLLLEGPGGNLTLRVAEWNGAGYDVLDNDSFPQETDLDTYHADDGEIYLWVDIRDQGSIALTFKRREAGWKLTDQTDGNTWSLGWSAIDNWWQDDDWWADHSCNDGYTYGSYPPAMQRFEELDVMALPTTVEQALAILDRSGWAVVNNPEPTDCLLLHVAPDEGAESLGAFYNRTPVRGISEEGEWSQVIIGEDGLTGWMMTEYLAFGEAMDEVFSAFPQEVSDCSAQAAPDVSTPEKWEYRCSQDFVIGVLGDEWYIVMEPYEGWVGYVPVN